MLFFQTSGYVIKERLLWRILPLSIYNLISMPDMHEYLNGYLIMT